MKWGVIADKQHVGLHQLISILLSANQRMEHSIATHLAAGVPEKKVSKATKERNLAIKRLFELYQSGNIAISDYMYGIQSNLSLK